jgi:hypothetical protein
LDSKGGGIVTYNKTNWEDGVTPLSAQNLNKIEQGIYLNSILATYPFISNLPLANKTMVNNEKFASNQVAYKNLYIPSGVTAIANEGVQVIFVSGLLSLGGTISAVGKGAAGGEITLGGVGITRGGNGGGILIIIANQIAVLPGGSIVADGANGANGYYLNNTEIIPGGAGEPGYLFGIDLAGNIAAYSDGYNVIYPTSLGYGVTTKGTRVPVGYDALCGKTGANTIRKLDKNLLSKMVLSDTGGAGGGAGCSCGYDRHDYIGGAGGGGGAGVAGDGAVGGIGAFYGHGDGGGGGGGGGLAFVMSLTDVENITITAKGGIGGAGYTEEWGAGVNMGCGGGGGGGGAALLLAPSITNCTLTVTGGAGGAASPLGGNAGSAGANGVSYEGQIP